MSAPSENECKSAVDFSTVTDDEADQALKYSMNLVEPAQRARIAAAHVMYYAFKERARQANQWYCEYQRMGLTEDPEFRLVEGYLAKLRDTSLLAQ